MTRPVLFKRARQVYLPWLSFALISTLIFLSSCTSSAIQTQVTGTPIVKINPTSTKPISTSTPSSDNTTQSSENFFDEIAFLHHLQSPQGWMWRVTLPANRFVIYYGNPFSSAIGPLGAYSDDELLARLRQQAQAYANLDPKHLVIPAFDYVTPVAQASPTADDTWRARMPDDSIEHYRNLANANHMLFFKPGVEIVTSVDGFGTPEAKIGDYRIFDKQQLIQYPGFKLFYRWDHPLMSSSAVLKLDPPPLMVMY